MKNIVVAGASKGIGLELARQYAEAGERVYALSRDPSSSDGLGALADKHDNVTTHAVDVSDDASVDAFADALDADRIDLLLNVAGIVGHDETIENRDREHYMRSFNIMTLGPLRMTQAMLPKMQDGSKIMSLSSQLAASTWPMGSYYAYGAAKAGLNRLMRSVAIDLKDRGIVVGLIHPGYVQTDMGGPDADITPQESASLIRQTVSDWSINDSGEFKKWNGENHAW